MFTPKWKSEAKYLVKGARKFLQYKLDLLKPEHIGEIESRREDLIDAIKSGDRKKVDEASKHLRATCDDALPHQKPTNWFEENVEVMFVAIVIALGLRAYYLQPFRIPTGSMQPTLNGIVGEHTTDRPAFPKRIAQKVLKGRSYVKVINDRDRYIAFNKEGEPDIRNVQVNHFFSRSEMHFRGSEPLRLPAPASPCLEAGLREVIQAAYNNKGLIPKGTVLVEGTIDSGDLVLVNKFAYHFRNPQRGEVFVFDTIGIRGIDIRSGAQAKGSHYIKRLCGVPGDTLEIKKPHLMVNGKIAQEPGIQKIAETAGYILANDERKPHRQYLAEPGQTMTLKIDTQPGMSEYVALGDNTDNSLDSRYWGTVKEYNLAGPALFSLWPITSGHWGFIK